MQEESALDVSVHGVGEYPILATGGKAFFEATTHEKGSEEKMPVRMGKVGDAKVTTLRDSGCSGLVVKKKFVQPNEYTGNHGVMQLSDNTVKRVPIARIMVDTLFDRSGRGAMSGGCCL